jgi:hypothetical protein
MQRAMTTFVVAFVLGVAAQAATASTFAIVEPTFRATWRSFVFQGSEGSRVTCPVTLEGTFTGVTMAKTAGARIGNVTGSSIGTCTGGSARALTETLPWTIQYSSFSGVLPEITGVTMRAIGAGFKIHPTSLPECLARTEERNPLTLAMARDAEGIVTSMRAEEGVTYPLTGEFLCSLVTGRVSGTAETVTVARETQQVEILLGARGLAAIATGVEAGENVADGLVPLVVPSGSPEETLGITNRDTSYKLTLTQATLAGANSEKLELLQEEENACRTGFVLLKRTGNVCNVRVRVKSGVTRPFTTLFSFSYRWGWLITDSASEEFNVEVRR